MRDALGSLTSRGLLRPQFDSWLLEKMLPKHPGYYGELVWILAMLEFWLRQRRPDFNMRNYQ
jgi:asparagine synthase (glutamine-hydrolysing)